MAAVALALLTVSCSSTSKPEQSARSAGATTTVVDAATPESVVPTEGGTAQGTASASAKKAAGAAGGAASAATQTGAAAPVASAGPLGRGITATEIRIGIQVNEPIDYRAFGGQEGSTNDPQRAGQALVNHLNSAGGIAGRKIVAFFHRTDVNNGSFAAQVQAACTDFTQDKKVFAAMTTASGTDNVQCYVDNRTPYLHDKRTLYDDEIFRAAAGWFYHPGRMSGNRWLVAHVDTLAAQGFFTGARLGILRYDTPLWKRMVDGILRPRLASHGVKPVEEIAIKPPGNTAELGAAAAELNSAILRLRTSNVDHVIFAEDGGAMPFLFMPQAEGQGYRPRYGFHSLNAIQFMESNVPKAQLARSIGTGWVPADDVNARQEAGDNATTARCLQILAAANLKPSTSTDTTSALSMCNGLLFLKTALERAKELNAAGLRAAVEGLGTAYLAPNTFASRFGPGRYDGAAAVRSLAFDDGCGCFKYTGPLRAVS